MEATAEGTMYNGCHNDIRLPIDYTDIPEILHVVNTQQLSLHTYRSIGILYILATDPDCGIHRSIGLVRGSLVCV